MNEVLIIGGGFAGSTVGCYLSRDGIQNVILESNMHPRPHVGESLVMSTVRVFDEIGSLPIMESQDFIHKYDASWHEVGGREAAIRLSLLV